jgi:hypothetical protein
LDSHYPRVQEIIQEANGLIDEGHPEQQQIHNKREEVIEAWHKLGTLSATRYCMMGNESLENYGITNILWF